MNLHTIIFSDVHLGSPISRAYTLLETLRKHRFKQLIIAGDMFEDFRFRNLTSTHWELLEHIGKLSRRGVRVVWLAGNHDFRFYHFMARMIGIPHYREYSWEVSGTRFLAMHGHQFDSFLLENRVLGNVLARLYASFQRIISSHAFDLLTSRVSDKWMRFSEQVSLRAVRYAKKKKCDVVICGHTHIVKNEEINGIKYCNTGCWTTSPSHLLTVSDTAEIKMETVP